MTGKIDPKVIAAAAILTLITVPVTTYARVNSLSGGIGTSFDYSDRSYDNNRIDTNDYRRISLRPMINFESTSEKDSYRLRAAPSIKYDLDNEETDWDSNLTVAADRFIYQRWQLQFSNTFLRSDYYDEATTTTVSDPAESTPESPGLSDPVLSSDLGRQRYWRNTLNVSSNHFYREDSLFRVGFNYIALRYDDSDFRDYEDYDRYVFNLRDEHRFNAIWRTLADFNYVIGNYDELQDSQGILPVDNDNLSRDLQEYRLLLRAENDSIKHNPLSLNYYFISTDYDAPLRSDIYIHQMRLTWQRDYSPRMYTRLGGGPSYGKAEGNDAQWGGNGIAELNYLLERGFVNFKVDKRYEVDNFSGNSESGALDSWNTSLSGQYRLLEDLTASGSLTYINEDRDNQFSDIVNIPDSYTKDVYIAAVGLNYDFWQHYTASVDYTYLNQDSERLGDSYDDHRILLTLSWAKEFYRW